MISKYKHKEITWIDLEKPKQGELEYAIEEYSLPAHIKDKIILDKDNDKVNLDNDLIYVSLKIPYHYQNEYYDNKIVLIASDDFVITIHDNPIPTWVKLLKEIELDVITEGNLDINNHKLLLTHLIKNLFSDSQNKLINNHIDIKELNRKIINQDKQLKFFRLLFVIFLIIIIILSIYALSTI